MDSPKPFLTEVTVHSLSGTRWFRNSFVDLLIEISEEGHFTNFTFSFTKRKRSLSVEWDGYRLRTFAIDEGEESPLHNQTPIVSTELETSPQEAFELFHEISGDLETEIVDYVSARIASRI